MSAIEWLPRGMEQEAPPITQLLPVRRELKYRVGGNRIITDAVESDFNPHWWLFELGSSFWRVGYDEKQRPVYEITLVQPQVFHVLLVDYWKPPIELWRRNQPIVYNPILVPQTYNTAPAVSGSADSGSGLAVGSNDPTVAHAQTGVAG